MQNDIKPLAAGARVIARARSLLSAGVPFIPWLAVAVAIA